MTFPYPSIDLPDFPLLPGSSADPPEEWEKVFEKLGMRPLLVARGKALDRHVEEGCRQKVEQLPREEARKMLLSTPSKMEHRVALWIHPAGLVGLIEGYLWPNQKKWTLSGVRLEALVQAPFDEIVTGATTSDMVTGEDVSELSWRACDQEKFETENPRWKLRSQQIKEAGRRGLLVPLSQWAVIAQQAPQVRWTIFQEALSAWSKLALDWEQETVFSKATGIPMERERLVDQSLVHALPTIQRKLRQGLGEDTHALGALLEKVLQEKAEGWKNSGKLPVVTPDQRKEFRTSFVSGELKKLLKEGIQTQPFLTLSQKETVSSWVLNLSRDDPSSLQEWEGLSNHVDGLEGLSKLDLALACTTRINVWERVQQTIQASSDQVLERWVEGKGCHVPLGLGIAKALLDIADRYQEEEELAALQKGVFQSLDCLVERLGADRLCWEGDTQNVWGAALGWHVNLPTDDDLKALHQRYLWDFLRWSQKHAVRLPETIRWTSLGGESSIRGKTFECEISDFPTFEAQWRENAQDWKRPASSHYWDLLKPVRSLALEARLEKTLGEGEQVPRRLRM